MAVQTMQKGFLGNLLKSLLHAIVPVSDSGLMTDLLGEDAFHAMGDWFKGQLGSGMTNREKEVMDYQNKWQEDFYRNYGSPSAQIQSTAAGYDEVGLNRMLMAGQSPGATTASSGSPGSGQQADAGQILGDLIQSAIGMKKLGIEAKLRSRELDIQEKNADANISWLNSQTTGQNTKNLWLDRLFGAQVADLNASAGMKQEHTKLLTEQINSEQVRRELMRANTRLVDAQKVGQQLQNAILETQKKYADDYFKYLAQLQLANSALATDQAYLFRSTLQQRKESAIYELKHIIIKAGMDAKILTGEGFEHTTSGTMTDKDKTEAWLGLLGGVLNTATGAALGFAMGRVPNAPIQPSPWHLTPSAGGMPISYGYGRWPQ